jgi:hypothetical protein
MMAQIEKLLIGEDFHGKARCRRTITEAFTGIKIFWECPKWSGFVVTYAREPFDHAKALRLIEFMQGNWDGSMPGKGMRILPGLAPNGMDVAVLLGIPHLRKVGTIDRSLDDRTVFAFPAYRSEFSGFESPELFDELIHTRSDIGDWGRPMRPQTWIVIRNPGARARARRVGVACLAELATVQDEIRHLANEAGYLEITNFERHTMQIVSSENAMILKCPDMQSEIFRGSPEAAVRFVNVFLIEGKAGLTATV